MQQSPVQIELCYPGGSKPQASLHGKEEAGQQRGSGEGLASLW